MASTSLISNIPAILFMYWCVDERKGQRLALLLLLSAGLNTALKLGRRLMGVRPQGGETALPRLFFLKFPLQAAPTPG
jgi:hypothetical protein